MIAAWARSNSLTVTTSRYLAIAFLYAQSDDHQYVMVPGVLFKFSCPDLSIVNEAVLAHVTTRTVCEDISGTLRRWFSLLFRAVFHGSDGKCESPV